MGQSINIISKFFHQNSFIKRIFGLVIYKIDNYCSSSKVFSLKEKGQYVTNAFTTTYDYLVFVTKILPSVTSVTSR